MTTTRRRIPGGSEDLRALEDGEVLPARYDRPWKAMEVGLAGKRRRHVPLRSCIACRQARPKRELIRIVHTPEGMIEVDLSGKRSGRGAYLCPDQRCWALALPRRLAQALRCEISAEQLTTLRDTAAPLFAKAVDGPEPDQESRLPAQ